MAKAVIFDMDGVMVDSEPLHKKTERVTLSPYGICPSDEELDTYMGTEASTLLRTFIRIHRLNVSFDDLYAAYKQNLLRIFRDEVKPIEAALLLISGLKSEGVPLAVGSSSNRDLVRLVLDRIGVEHAFEVVVSGDDVGRSKPAPDIFLEVARRLGLLPADCVVIEDSANGVRAAKAAGMGCVGFRNPNSANQDLGSADRLVDSLSELVGLSPDRWLASSSGS